MDKPGQDHNFLSPLFGVLENKYLRARINPDGTISIFDKVNGNEFRQLNFFEDKGDIGDEYTYSRPLKDEVVSTLNKSAQVSQVQNSSLNATYKVAHTLNIPAELSPDRQQRGKKTKEQKIISYISLKKESRIIEIQSEIENNIKNHLLQAGFDTGIKSQYSFAEQPFDIVEFPVHVDQPKPDIWIEDQPGHFPVQRFCGFSDGKKGLLIINRNSPEYTADKEGRIYLTFLRSIGYLSLDGLQSRAGNAGPSVETPDAQMMGRKIILNYALYPFKGKKEDDKELLKQVENYYSQPYIHTVNNKPGKQPQTNIPVKDGFSLFSIQGQVAYSTLKQAEKDPSMLILRFWNPYDRMEKVKVSFNKNIKLKSCSLLKLNETKAKNLNPADNAVELECPPRKIITIGFSA